MEDSSFHAAAPDLPMLVAHEYAVLTISVVIFIVASCAVAMHWRRRFASRHATTSPAARDMESLRNLAEAIPLIVWIAGPDGKTSYINRRWYEMTGTPSDQSLGTAWMDTVHPDDREPCLTRWKECLHSGTAFEIEYRLRDASGGYRWYLDRAIPLRDASGAIVQWIGTCTDIDGQMRNQQLLEEQIRERTSELFEANTKLQEEMWEKDLARKQLDEQNDKMMQDLTDRSSRATMLAKMGELLQSCVTQEEVLKAALGFAPRIFSSSGALALFNQQDNLEVASSWSDCLVPLPVFERSACWALRTGHTHFVPSGDDTARCAHAEGVTNSYVCIPIIAQGETLGILHFQANAARPQLPSRISP